MTKRIPSDAELRFIETTSTRTVHIAVAYKPWHLTAEQTIETVSGGAAFLAAAVHPTVTRCGKRTFPQTEKAHQGTDRFSDDRLCAACYRTLAPEDQERAFEHDQPDQTAE